MYNKGISYQNAMEQYNISETCAHKYMTDNKWSQGIPVMSHNVSTLNIQHTSSDMETYMSISKEKLIN